MLRGSLYLSVAGPGGLVESRPELHTELVMATRGCSWNPFGNKAVIRSWRIPHRTPRPFACGAEMRDGSDGDRLRQHRRHASRRHQPPTTRVPWLNRDGRVLPLVRLLRGPSLREAQVVHWIGAPPFPGNGQHRSKRQRQSPLPLTLTDSAPFHPAPIYPVHPTRP